jgi:hypothetical protein
MPWVLSFVMGVVPTVAGMLVAKSMKRSRHDRP